MKWVSCIIVSGTLMLGVSYGAQSVSGVLENLRGKPIKNASALLQAKHHAFKAKTHKDGKFLFKELNSGQYFFSAQKKHLLTFAEPMLINQKSKKSMEVALIPVEFAVFHYLPVKTAYF